MQALVIRRPEIGRVSPLCFYFMASLPTGPYTILFRVTCVFAGLHFEPCDPPVLLTLAGIVPREASILNLTYTGSGSNKLRDSVMKLVL
jgi:hypothetical protein